MVPNLIHRKMIEILTEIEDFEKKNKKIEIIIFKKICFLGRFYSNVNFFSKTCDLRVFIKGIFAFVISKITIFKFSLLKKLWH